MNSIVKKSILKATIDNLKIFLISFDFTGNFLVDSLLFFAILKLFLHIPTSFVV